jgi:hypothetical protein
MDFLIIKTSAASYNTRYRGLVIEMLACCLGILILSVSESFITSEKAKVKIEQEVVNPVYDFLDSMTIILKKPDNSQFSAFFNPLALQSHH